MALPETSCPECGQPTADEPSCIHCGWQPAGWLEVGDTFEMGVDPDELGLDVDHEEVNVELEMVELWETYEIRRVLLAHPVGISDADGISLADTILEELDGRSFVVEQDDARTRCRDEVMPDELIEAVRVPLFRGERTGRPVAVYGNDSGLALDEIVEIAAGKLNLAQIRGLFMPVVDAVAELHEQNLLHLRLTPWTVRVFDGSDGNGLPLEFLRQTMEPLDSYHEPVGLEEDTFSDVQVEGGATDEPSRSFASAENASERTREDVVPLLQADYSVPADSDESSDPQEIRRELSEVSDAGTVYLAESEAAVCEEPDEIDLTVIFDGIEGFFEEGGSFEEVPIIRGFSPPELMGRAQLEIGRGCDVFNLGMMLYFLIGGQLPPVSVYTRHIPAVPARNLRPEFPPGLQSVISRATRPDPKERFPDVASLKKAFERACDVMKARAEGSAERTPRMKLAVDTHIGIAKRRRNPTNQDAVFGAASDDRRFALVVVADGVSTASYGSGDLASHMLIAEAKAAWEELLPSYLMDEPVDPIVAIRDILNRANDRIVNYVNENFLPFRGGPHEVMGTTALVAVLQDGKVTLGTLGDSRVYLQRGGAFEQITIDHNLWTLSILEGVPADNALAMPHGDALARCLGTFIVDNERLEAVHPEPDIFRFSVTSGDNLLLTTDGLVDFAAANMLSAEDKIHQMLVSEPDPALACLELILLANRGGGGDNIGLGIVKYA
ncbi:MAG: protein phosphatase 2C domain-containing protein [Persicimonas sp.]